MGPGVVLPALCLAVPPFHVLGHEFTALFSALAACVAYFVAVGISRQARSSPSAVGVVETLTISLHRSMAWAAASGILASGVLLLANVLRFGCDAGKGAGFFWVTWLPLALVSCVSGVVIGFHTDRHRFSLLPVMLGVTWMIVQDTMQALVGPHMPVDLFLGFLLVLQQRAQAGIPDVHLWQRLYLLLYGYLFWNANLWWCLARDHPLGGVVRSRTVIAAILFLALAAHHGMYVGMGWWGYGRLEEALPGAVHTDHFDIRFQTDSHIASQIRAIARRAEWSWHELESRWPVPPGSRIDVWVADDPMLVNLTGMTSHANVHSIFISPWAATTDVFLHELVHALTIDLRPHPLAPLCRGLMEGLGQAYERGYVQDPGPHALLASALDAGSLPRARAIMALAGFWQLEESAAYEAAGSFVGFLNLRYGREKLLALCRTLDYEGTFGRSLDLLDLEWREFLSAVPRSAEARTRASRVFDAVGQPSFTSRPCPKLGPGRDDPESVAQRLWEQEAWEEALGAFRKLHRAEPKVRWIRAQIDCLERLKRLPEAIAGLDRALASPGLPAHERAALVTQKIRCLAKMRSWSALATLFAARDAVDLDPNDRMIGLVLADPAVRDRMAEVLTTYDVESRRALVEELERRRPGSLAAAYFRAVWCSPFAGGDGGAARWKRVVDLAPDQADRAAEHLLGVLERFVTRGDTVQAPVIGDTIRRISRRPFVEWRVRRELERAEFERTVKIRVDGDG